VTTPAPTEFIVVRHGETVWNVEARLQGHGDSALTPLGIRQSEAVAGRLAGEQFDALYSSDLPRALATAQTIARRSGHRILTDPRLRERSFGLFEGLTRPQIAERFPDHYQRYLARDPDHVVPGGESRRDLYLRVTACLEDIAGQRPGQRIVVVAHGGVLAAMFRRALSKDLEDTLSIPLVNAALNVFFIGNGLWTLSVENDTAHLTGIGFEEAGEKFTL
jgi:probable phosphoglycerate mutase